MGHPRALIILFSRAPILGQVKQRLAREIGNMAALKVHENLFARTLKIIAQSAIKFKLYLSGSPSANFPHEYLLQQGNDLGERMAAAIKAELENSPKVCLIGSDCLDLQASDLTTALALLETTDLVLGPAEDGGYYLIAMKNFIPDLFRDIKWGTDTVLEESLKIANGLGLKTALLAKRIDVDRISDLPENWKEW